MLKPQDQTTSHLSSSKSVINSHPSLSTLNKSKGFLIENPDGTLIQGIIFSEKTFNFLLVRPYNQVKGTDNLIKAIIM